VPPNPEKNFDLPYRVTSRVSEKVGKQYVTDGFVFNRQKSSVKESLFNEKWKLWENAEISFQKASSFDVNDKTIILIDDKYQSGITIQYIAMKLQQAGAREVYGLTFVKTLSDTDNV
jgi:predicted amidophosphoribosyltransferase